jgi:diketogulonate reductase-like aldo/keto reductase
MVQVALRWAWQLGIATVTKTEKVERMEENLAIFHFSLDQEDMEAISGLHRDLRLFGNPARFP